MVTLEMHSMVVTSTCGLLLKVIFMIQMTPTQPAKRHHQAAEVVGEDCRASPNMLRTQRT